MFEFLQTRLFELLELVSNMEYFVKFKIVLGGGDGVALLILIETTEKNYPQKVIVAMTTAKKHMISRSNTRSRSWMMFELVLSNGIF